MKSKPFREARPSAGRGLQVAENLSPVVSSHLIFADGPHGAEFR